VFVIGRYCLTALTVFFLAAPAAHTAKAAEPIIIGTGSKGAVYFPTGHAICRLLDEYGQKNGQKYLCQARETLGSVANLKALQAGKFQLGIVQSDAQYHAVKGIRKFKKGAMRELRSLFSLHAETFTVMARVDAGIRNLGHLQRRRINVGKKGSGPRETFIELMGALGWKASKVAGFTQFSPAEQAAALCDGRTDVLTYVVGHPANIIRKASALCRMNLVNIYGPAVNKMLKKWPYYRQARILAGLYRGTDTDIRSFGLSATLVATTKLDADTAYAITAAVFSNLKKFRNMHPALKYLNQQEMVHDSLSAPLHDGAKRYFKENGLR
jgi:uncharacterized protein